MKRDTCGKKCDHGSPCILSTGHIPADRHETEHGCVFYDCVSMGCSVDTRQANPIGEPIAGIDVECNGDKIGSISIVPLGTQKDPNAILIGNVLYPGNFPEWDIEASLFAEIRNALERDFLRQPATTHVPATARSSAEAALNKAWMDGDLRIRKLTWANTAQELQEKKWCGRKEWADDDWNKNSMAVIAALGKDGQGLVLQFYGPHVDFELEESGCGPLLEDLGVQAPGCGLWLWTGCVVLTGGHEYGFDSEWQGEWRRLTREEAHRVAAGELFADGFFHTTK